jgi:hypothetical protein
MSANINIKFKEYFQKEKDSINNDLNIPLYKNNINIRIKKIGLIVGFFKIIFLI